MVPVVTALHNSMPTPYQTNPTPAPLDEWGDAITARGLVRRAVHGIRRAILGDRGEGVRAAREHEARKARQYARRERRAKARRAAGGE